MRDAAQIIIVISDIETLHSTIQVLRTLWDWGWGGGFSGAFQGILGKSCRARGLKDSGEKEGG